MPRQAEEKLEYQDFLNWTLTSLKDFLALRGLKQTGKKAELVARAFGAYELKAPKKFSQEEIDRKLKEEYQQRLRKHRINTDPNSIQKEDWKENVHEWPNLDDGMLFSYILRVKAVDVDYIVKRIFSPKYSQGARIFGSTQLLHLSTLSFNAHADKVCKKLASRIAILRKIRTYLPLPQRIQYYNSIISPVMSYVSAIWSNCDKELLYRVFKLQKRAARVILYAERMAPSVELFNRLKWIPFYEKCKIDKASIMFKRIHGALPSYLNEHIPINNSRHSRTTRYSNFNVLCPRYNRETEGGRTFLVTGTKIWNFFNF
nr:uncharacterized protein LOC131781114 [Pocillopora verrucosa]